MQVHSRKLKVVLCSFLFMLSPLLKGQTPVLDSLERQLRIHHVKDTIRVDLLIEYGNASQYAGNEKTILYLEEALTISENLGDFDRKANAYQTLGYLYSYRSDYDQATTNLEQTIELYQSSNNLSGLAYTYNGLSVINSKQRKYDVALVWSNKALELSMEINDVKGVLNALNEIGTILHGAGKYDEALTYYEKALLISESVNNGIMQAQVHGNLGSMYMSQGNNTFAMEHFNQSLVIAGSLSKPDLRIVTTSLYNLGVLYLYEKKYDKSLVYFERVLEEFQSQKNKDAESFVLMNIASIYVHQKKYSLAESFYDKSLEICQETGNRYSLANCLGNMGMLNVELGRFDEALSELNQCLTICEQMGNKKTACLAHRGLANAYFEKGQLKNARKHATLTLTLAIELDLVREQQDCYRLLSEIYDAQGNYEKAYHNYVQYKVLSDSLFNRENVEKITALEFEYAYHSKLDSARQKELELTNQVITAEVKYEKSQKQLYLGIAISLSLIVILGIIIFLLRSVSKKSKNKHIMAEQKLLRSQMTPHFIFNTLTVLQGIVVNSEPKKTMSYITKFSKLLRNVLENSRDKLVSLESELKIINNYIELQNLGTGIPYNCEIIIDQIINPNKTMIPPMLIQPFVENSIEHGFRVNQTDRQIKITFKLDDKNLYCSVEDNGVGLKSDYPNSSSIEKRSLATAITSERLEILSRVFNTQTGVEIKNRSNVEASGAIVNLKLPYDLSTI